MAGCLFDDGAMAVLGKLSSEEMELVTAARAHFETFPFWATFCGAPRGGARAGNLQPRALILCSLYAFGVDFSRGRVIGPHVPVCAGARACGDAALREKVSLSQEQALTWPAPRAPARARAEGSEVFWASVWQRRLLEADADKAKLVRNFREAGALDALVARLVERCYPAGAYGPVVLDGYGFVGNPPGSRTQAWHVDYCDDYSSLMIPFEHFTPQNTTQYAVLPQVPRGREAAVARALSDTDNIDMSALIAELPCVSLRQLAAVPGSLVRMNFGCVHRGVRNASPAGCTRLAFYVSVVRNGAEVPVEPLVTDFEVDRAAAVIAAAAAAAGGRVASGGESDAADAPGGHLVR